MVFNEIIYDERERKGFAVVRGLFDLQIVFLSLDQARANFGRRPFTAH